MPNDVTRFDQWINNIKGKYLNIRSNILGIMSVSEAWNLLQQAIMEIVIAIESIKELTSGSDKKKIALKAVSSFYDTVIYPIRILPRFLFFLDPVADYIIKRIFIMLASGSIDATVTLLNILGIFQKERQNDRQS